MKYGLEQLEPAQFEQLCAALLIAEGYKVTIFATRGAIDGGIDFLLERPDGAKGIGQSKLFRRSRAPISALRSAALDLRNGLTMGEVTFALLIVSAELSAEAFQVLSTGPEVLAWDGNTIEMLLEKHPSILRAYLGFEKAREKLNSFVREEAPTDDSVSAALLAELAAIPKGTGGWREYEATCVKVLNYAFIPPLRIPKVQSRTHDGLDRRDAIYPIGSGHAFWDSIKYEYSARMAVVEFKNHDGEVGQEEVESLQQYLMPQAKRSFGILCSRDKPSPSAVKARRRAWMMASNLILFLSDLDLEELIRTKASGEDTSRVLESQMDDFFITLAP